MNTKKRLVASLLAMAMCFTMLIGSTFAWFTDNASTAVNTIQSGTLKIGMYADESCTDSVENETLSFIKAGENVLWEPGSEWKLPTVYLKNEGNLAVKYKVQITGINGDAELNKVIDWTISTGDGHLGVEEAEEITISGKMQETAGNEYQGLTIDGIAISVVATQDTVEHDSFNNTYDANAEYPLYPNERRAATDEELAEILANLNGVDTIYLTEGTFNAFNIPYKTFDLIGTADENGNPLTKIYFDELATDWKSDSCWAGYTGTVENILFEAKEGIEDNGTFTNSALLLHDDEGSDVTFKNCKFVNMGIQSSGALTAVDCTFEGNGNAFKAIAFIDPTGDLTVDGCTFSGYTGSEWGCTINVQSGWNSTVTIKNCDIKDGSKSEIGNLNKIVLENNKINEDFIIYFSATIVEESGNTFGENGKITKQGL